MMEILRRWCRAIYGWLLGFHICPMITRHDCETVRFETDHAAEIVLVTWFKKGEVVVELAMNVDLARQFSDKLAESLTNPTP